MLLDKLVKKPRPKLNLVKRKKKEVTYLDGGEGFIKWIEDFVYIEIYVNGLACYCPMSNLPTEINPETGRCSKDMWDFQKQVALDGLKMRNGRFIYRLIVLCWMRGEGKSLFVCLIQLWKFFNFPSQKIMLGANSRDQVKFVHFDIMRNIILNSPRLIQIIGTKNVQEKEIRLKNSKGEVVSFVRSISSFSGIVSNITGYTFSEIFDMKNPKFFTQLDGSIRNVPNAMGVIDSTVSTKDHILYRLYEAWKSGQDTSLHFSHRESVKGDHRDFTNPEMTQKQLQSYRAKFPSREFAMYFKNTWDAGAKKMFPEDVILALRYVGCQGSIGEFQKIKKICGNYIQAREENKGVIEGWTREARALDTLKPIEDFYSLSTSFQQPRRVTIDELLELSKIYDTNFALSVGVDRADPMKIDITVGAKTIVTLTAKGLPGSKSNPVISLQQDTSVDRYIYFVLDVSHVIENDINTIKSIIEKYTDEYGSVETLCSERWGMWDIGEWCEDLEIIFHTTTGSYTVQKEGFSELYNIFMTGRIKCPPVMIPGVRGDDIFLEELGFFDHDATRKFYGSPEKKDKFGIQDDSIYSLNNGIYGGRLLTMDDFVPRDGNQVFSTYHEDKTTLVGDYR